MSAYTNPQPGMEMERLTTLSRYSSDTGALKGSDATTPTGGDSKPWGLSIPPPPPRDVSYNGSYNVYKNEPSYNTSGGSGGEVAIAMEPAVRSSLAAKKKKPLELSYHRYDDGAWTRWLFPSYQEFICVVDNSMPKGDADSSQDKPQKKDGGSSKKKGGKQTDSNAHRATVTWRTANTQHNFNPEVVLHDMMRTRRHLSKSRLHVSSLIYFVSMVATLSLGVSVACMPPTPTNNTTTGALTIFTALVTGLLNAISSMFTSWEHEVIAAQTRLSHRFKHVPAPSTAEHVKFGIYKKSEWEDDLDMQRENMAHDAELKKQQQAAE